MSARVSPRRLAISSLVVALWLAPPASAGQRMCQARASASGRDPPVTVSFQALAAGGAPSHFFHWDFGDGSTDSRPDPTHVYTEQGIYSAVLTVSDAVAPYQVCRDTVVIYVGIVVDPFCGATASPRWGDAPLVVQFGAYPGLVGDPGPYTWSWRFGDGATSAVQPPVHVYDTPGTYYAVATLHTSVSSYDCLPTLRVSALEPSVSDVDPAGRGTELRLEPPRPTPFATLTALSFALPRAGHVRLQISDPAGRSVATLVDEHRSAGRGVAVWQGRLAAGQRAAPGLYFVRLEHDGVVRTRKLVRL